jgi:hypothetical protein
LEYFAGFGIDKQKEINNLSESIPGGFPFTKGKPATKIFQIMEVGYPQGSKKSIDLIVNWIYFA